MIFLFASSVFDGVTDADTLVITTNKAFGRAILDAGFDSVIWDVELTEEQSELIEAGQGDVTEALNE